MSKIITILGGNGYIGSKCIEVLLKNTKDVKIYSVSRSGKMKYKQFDHRVESIKGDCLHPTAFEDIIKKSTGIIHSIGLLFAETANYHLMNKETCLRVAKIANESEHKEKPNFVYISAERGIPFPLSLKFHGYIESKRECEKELNKLSNINSIILRPGFVKSTEKAWTLPIYYGVNLAELVDKKLISKINSNAGEALQLPSRGIDLDVLAHFAAAGALGNLKPNIYPNDYLNDKTNFKDLNLL